MIRHIVFFNLRNPENRRAVAEGLCLLKQIPGDHLLEVGEDLSADTLSGEVDLVVYGEFPDLAALQAYKAHPLYEEAIRRVRPLRELRMAADYEAPGLALEPAAE